MSKLQLELLIIIANKIFDLKAFIFDLDGVIVDTAKYHFKSWKIIGKKLGFELTKTQNEFLKGVSREESLDKILNWEEFQSTEWIRKNI